MPFDQPNGPVDHEKTILSQMLGESQQAAVQQAFAMRVQIAKLQEQITENDSVITSLKDQIAKLAATPAEQTE